MSIAFDSASNGAVATNTDLTVAHTCSGSNRALVVTLTQQGSPNAPSVTYGGVAMTALTSRSYTNGRVDTFILLNPAAGANNIVASVSCDGKSLSAASYTGVRQSSQPDATTGAANNTASTSVTASNTSVSDKCWTILSIGVQGNGVSSTNIAASTGATQRAVNNSVSQGSGLYDSNSAKTPAGSVSISVTFTSGRYGYNILSLAPVLDVVAADSFTLTDAVSLIRQLRITVLETLHVLEIQYVTVSDAIGLSEAFSTLKQGFKNLVKNAGSWLNTSKSDNASITNTDKHSATFTNQEKH